MAIDDNTSYELTGAQVKDLANKIRSKAADNIFVGATSAIPGSKGLVPQPQAGDDTKFLSGDGLWKTVSQYNLPIASSSTLGGIKVGNNLTIDPVTGVLDADGSTYTAGNGINISANDEISVDTSVVAEVSDLPTKTSDLTNDGSDGTSTYVEADDLATVATSGNYNDLTNKPTIPTVNNATLTVQKNGTSVGTFTANASSNKTINITVPTTAADVSALPDTTKYGASILVSIDSTTYKLTTTLKDQDGNTLGTAQVVDLPLESVVVSGAYDSQTKEVVLTLVNGSTIRFSVADLVSGLQAEITSTNKLDADLVDDSTSTHKFTTAANLTKLAGIAAGAEVNQNAFSNVKVGNTTVAADSKTDTLELTAGTNVTLTPDATNDKVTIAAKDTTYTFANGTNGFTVTPSDGSAQTVTVTPSIADATTSAHGLMSASDKTKLNGIASGAEVNVQSDWNVTDSTSDAFIKNKPTIPTVNNATLTIQKNGTTVKTFTANASSNVTANITVPTKTSDITNDSGYITKSVNNLDNYTTTTNMNTALGKKVDVDSINLEGQTTTILAQVQALAGADKDYGRFSTDTDGGASGISDKPTGTTNKGFCCTAYRMRDYGTEDTYYLTCYVRDGSDTNPYVAVVAQNSTSITWKRQQPTVNNATLTIQKNGTNVQTFTANQSTNATANITVPTKTSDITNDSNFPVDANYVHTDNNFTTTLKNKLNGIATGAEVNQNAFSNVKVGSSTVAADSKTDTLEIVAGDNISLAADTTNDKVTITGKNMVYTNNNLAPGEDTPASWQTLFNTSSSTGVGPHSGYFVTWYNTANKFTNQPSQYGFLETFVQGSDIHQRWYTQSGGPERYRSGNASGWNSTYFPNGVFKVIASTGDIPTVNNGQLTIQKNGTNVATFTANQSTAATANITVPTKTSDLTNDSNFVADASYVHTDNNFTTTLKNKLNGIASGAEVNVQSDWNVTNSSSDAFIKNKPTIPTVNNGTLTIQKNGTNVQTFTANQSTNVTANITSPEITMANTDPGAGSALAANHYVAVYGNSDGTIQTADIANGAVTSAKIGWASLAAGAMASTVVAGSSSTDNGWTVLRIANNVRIYMRYFTGSTTVGASSWGQDDLGTLPSSATSKTWFGFVSGKASDNAVSYTGTIWENGHVAMSKINNYNQQLTVTYEATAIAVVIGV